MSKRNKIIMKRILLILLITIMVHISATLIYCRVVDVNRTSVWLFLSVLSLVLLIADLIACAKAVKVKDFFEEPYDGFELAERDPEDEDGEKFQLEVHDIRTPHYEGNCLVAIDDPFLYYLIDKENYIIGSDPKTSDCVLESKYVSPYHAFIITTKDMIFVQDIASDNGTYVNDVRIPSGAPYTIKHGDKIQFANMKFILHLTDNDNQEGIQNEKKK